MRRLFTYLLSILGSLAILASLAWIWIVFSVYYSARPYTHTTITDVPPAKVGIVFGAEVLPNGHLSPILQDRVDGAIALYQHHLILKLLMTGDNAEINYNEVGAMQHYAIAQGVPSADIVLDYAGFDTYDSCYRAKAIFGVDKAVLITQQYHLPRALYLCRSLGMDAVGYGIADFSKYPDLRVPYVTREWAADVKAWWRLHTHDKPKFLGTQLPI